MTDLAVIVMADENAGVFREASLAENPAKGFVFAQNGASYKPEELTPVSGIEISRICYISIPRDQTEDVAATLYQQIFEDLKLLSKDLPEVVAEEHREEAEAIAKQLGRPLIKSDVVLVGKTLKANHINNLGPNILYDVEVVVPYAMYARRG